MTARPNLGATALVAAVALACAGAAGAQDRRGGESADRGAERTAAPSTASARAVRDARLSQLIGMNVRDAQGRGIGEIEDLVVDLQNGRVQYAVLGFGGFLGLGEKLFAFPMSAFKVASNAGARNGGAGRAFDNDGVPGDKGPIGSDRPSAAAGSREPAAGVAGGAGQGARAASLSGTHLVLNVPEARLRQAPGFDRNRWPDFNDPAYRGELDKFAAANQARGTVQKNASLRRASELLDADVRDAQDTDVGDVEDIVVDLQSGRVRYAVVDFEPGWFQGDRLVVVPLTALRPRTDRDDPDLVFGGDRGRLSQAPAFEANRWPDLNAGSFRGTVDRWIAGWRSPNAPGAGMTGARDTQGTGRTAGGATSPSGASPSGSSSSTTTPR